MSIVKPMQVLVAWPKVALCIDRHGIEAYIDSSTVGDVGPGAWLLVLGETACEIIEPDRMQQIMLALGALDSLLHGDLGAIDATFPDLVGCEAEWLNGLDS